MAIATLQGIEHEFDKLELLRGLNLEISRGERVALVGANGTGKTTVFKILAKELLPTHGNILWAKGLRIGYLTQQPRMETDETVREVARKPFAELVQTETRMRELSARMAHESGETLGQLMRQYGQLEARHTAAGGFAWEHRVEQVLAGVGFAEDQRDRPCRVLSGGQQCRLALASILLGGADLLLLDEPTNHLDLEAVQWLEKYLNRLDAAVLLVSHDRYLLDRVATKVYELRNGVTEVYPGNYSNYVSEQKIRNLHRQRQFEKDQAYIAKERNFIARFHASGSRSREARGRATRLERQLKAGEFLTDSPRDDRTLSLKVAAGSRGSNLAVRATGLTKAFGAEPIVNDLTFDLYGGHKLAILGANGVGKTTILRMVLGEEAPDSGTIKVGSGMTIGYYDQKQTGLDDSLTVLDQMRTLVGEADEGTLRSFLARFLFAGKDVFKCVGTLSGGEKSRLLLAKLLYRKPNFLILDEPTNHLDIPSREVLEDALTEYDGTILLVSHDRYFVDRVCGRMLLTWKDRWDLIEGNYSYWRMVQEEKAAAEKAAAEAAEAETANAPAGKSRKAPPTAKGKTKPAATVGGLNSYQLSKLTIREVEDQIHQAESSLNDVEKSFSDPTVFSDTDKLAEVQGRYDSLREQIDQLMEVWQIKMEE